MNDESDEIPRQAPPSRGAKQLAGVVILGSALGACAWLAWSIVQSSDEATLHAGVIEKPNTPRPDPPAPELAIMQPARDAMRDDDHQQALDKLDEHRKRFPRGVLSDERDSKRVLALCALGRTDEAKEAAKAFLAARGDSDYALAVRASCVGEDEGS